MRKQSFTDRQNFQRDNLIGVTFITPFFFKRSWGQDGPQEDSNEEALPALGCQVEEILWRQGREGRQAGVERPL